MTASTPRRTTSLSSRRGQRRADRGFQRPCRRRDGGPRTRTRTATRCLRREPGGCAGGHRHPRGLPRPRPSRVASLLTPQGAAASLGDGAFPGGRRRARRAAAGARGEPATRRDGGDHIGLSGQSQPDRSVVGCLVPVGRITGDQLIEFGRLARVHGEGELRLTVQQNVLIPYVRESRIGALLGEPLLVTFSPNPSPWMRSVVTCTGSDFCHFSLIDTKAAAPEAGPGA